MFVCGIGDWFFSLCSSLLDCLVEATPVLSAENPSCVYDITIWGMMGDGKSVPPAGPFSLPLVLPSAQLSSGFSLYSPPSLSYRLPPLPSMVMF